MGDTYHPATGAGARLPVLVAVEDQPDLMREVERELNNRYVPDYRVVCLGSKEEALATLEEFAATGEQVALVLAGMLLAGSSGTSLLAEVPRMFPQAQRVLLVEWGRLGDTQTGESIFEAISHGRMDHYVLRPSQPPDEQFHQAISSFLLSWAEARQHAPHTVSVVGQSWSGRAYELRAVLEQCALPHRFHLADTDEARALIGGVGVSRFPLVVWPDGTILEDPSDEDIARASGTTVEPDRERYDLVIVGGGPAGLSAGVVWRLRRAADPGHRLGRRRRAGHVELLDPQLSGLSSWCQRWRAGPQGIPTGLGLRRPLRLHAKRSLTWRACVTASRCR